MSGFKFKIAISFLLPIFLTGCWDRTEVNDLSLVMATGIDKNKNNLIELTVQVFIPRPQTGGQQSGMSSGGSSGQTFVRSAEGKTIAGAMSHLQEELPRKIFWGQTEVLVLGEKLAKDGVSEHIDFWMRPSEPRMTADVFVCKGRSKEIMESMPELERDAAKQLNKLVKTQIGIKVTVIDLAQMLAGESDAAVLPWVENIPADRLGSKKKKIPFINGAAVFKKDKMVGRLDDRATRGVLWPRNEVDSAVITISPENQKGYVSLNLIGSRSNLVPTIKNGKWSMTVKTNAQFDVIQNTTNVNLFNSKIIHQVEQRVRQEIEGRERLAFSKVQKKWNADIFGFAETFERKYPEIWKTKKKEWNKIFQTVDISYKTEVSIERIGLANGKRKRGEEY